jgi:hypothetical protein
MHICLLIPSIPSFLWDKVFSDVSRNLKAIEEQSQVEGEDNDVVVQEDLQVCEIRAEVVSEIMELAFARAPLHRRRMLSELGEINQTVTSCT